MGKGGAKPPKVILVNSDKRLFQTLPVSQQDGQLPDLGMSALLLPGQPDSSLIRTHQLGTLGGPVLLHSAPKLTGLLTKQLGLQEGKGLEHTENHLGARFPSLPVSYQAHLGWLRDLHLGWNQHHAASPTHSSWDFLGSSQIDRKLWLGWEMEGHLEGPASQCCLHRRGSNWLPPSREHLKHHPTRAQEPQVLTTTKREVR